MELWLQLSNRDLHKFLSREVVQSGVYFTNIIMTQCGGLFGDGSHLEEKIPGCLVFFQFYRGVMGVDRWTWIYSILGKEKLIIWCLTGWAGKRRKRKKDLEVNMIPKSPP